MILWPIRSCTDSAQKISGTNANEDPSTPAITRNRPYSYSRRECGSNDISLHFVEFSNVHNTNRISNATQSNLVHKNVCKYRSIQTLL